MGLQSQLHLRAAHIALGRLLHLCVLSAGHAAKQQLSQSWCEDQMREQGRDPNPEPDSPAVHDSCCYHDHFLSCLAAMRAVVRAKWKRPGDPRRGRRAEVSGDQPCAQHFVFVETGQACWTLTFQRRFWRLYPLEAFCFQASE